MPEVDIQMLKHVVEQHVKEVGAKKAFFFGVYNNISRSQAVDGPGLAENQLLLKEASSWFAVLDGLCGFVIDKWFVFIWTKAGAPSGSPVRDQEQCPQNDLPETRLHFFGSE